MGNPHTKDSVRRDKGILPNVLHHIGGTPLIRINKISAAAGLECELLAKCEFFNAAGRVKDRIAKRMVEDAEKAGLIKPGDVIIEPTSGNTGLGLALCAAVKGYRCIIVLPEKMSNEKVDTLRALGAEIVRTPTSATWDSPESHISVAQRLNMQIPNSIILDQYRNPGNPLAHYDTTAEEIIEQCGGKVDMFVLGTGTGGTACGIGKKLKEKCNDMGTFKMARRLIREEGLLCGGSSGGTMDVAVKVAKELKKGQKCVALLADGVRNYMTKFLNDEWCAERDFIELENEQRLWWFDEKVSSLELSAPLTILPELSVEQALSIMNNEGFDQLPVIESSGKIAGVATLGSLKAKMLKENVLRNDAVIKATYKTFKKVTLDTTLEKLNRILDKEHFALVVHAQRLYISAKEVQEKEIIVGIVTDIDLLHHVSQKESRSGSSSGDNPICSKPGLLEQLLTSESISNS